MAITSIKTGSSFTNLQKYNDFLGPNAAFIPTDFESIATATGNGSSNEITFSSIPSTYKHLQIRLLGRSTTNQTNIAALIKCNGDGGTNYSRHTLQGDGATASASAVSTSSVMTSFRITAANAAANIMGVGIVDIHDYESTTKYKTFRSFSGQDQNGSGSILLQSGLWQSTSAINSLTIYLSADSFATSTVISLYGIKG